VDGAVRKPTLELLELLELLTLARRIGEPVAVALGNGAADTLGEHGAVKVPTHDAAEYADYLVVRKVDALQAAVVAVSPAAVLVPSSTEGKEIAARLALRIGSGINTDAQTTARRSSSTAGRSGGARRRAGQDGMICHCCRVCDAYGCCSTLAPSAVLPSSTPRESPL
jgi:electron transfer flavoprotein alpha subunit